jgi:hypothetical protein
MDQEEHQHRGKQGRIVKDRSHVFVRNWIDELHGDDMCALRTFTATMVKLESIMFPKYL